MAILAVCVLAWGTAYKCSLYKSLQEQAHTPVVKIDTRGSDMAKVQVEISCTPEAKFAATEPLETIHLRDSAAVWLLTDIRPDISVPLRYTPLRSLRPPPAPVSASV